MKIHVKHYDTESVLRLEGDFLSEPDQKMLRERVRELVAEGKSRLVVDLTHVHYINSCGLGSLVCSMTIARKAGGDLGLAGVGREVREILRVTRLDSIFEIHPSLEPVQSAQKAHHQH